MHVYVGGNFRMTSKTHVQCENSFSLTLNDIQWIFDLREANLDYISVHKLEIKVIKYSSIVRTGLFYYSLTYENIAHPKH